MRLLENLGLNATLLKKQASTLVLGFSRCWLVTTVCRDENNYFITAWTLSDLSVTWPATAECWPDTFHWDTIITHYYSIYNNMWKYKSTSCPLCATGMVGDVAHFMVARTINPCPGKVFGPTHSSLVLPTNNAPKRRRKRLVLIV